MPTRYVNLVLVAALLTATSTWSFAAKAKKHHAPAHPEAEHPKAEHPKPDHPKADHPKPDHPKPQKATAHKGPKVKRSKSRKRGQQAIDNGRAKQIQEALVREHYMIGEPSGSWDATTQQAMRRYQADQGWQTKEVPDSRALIRLGLGPDHGHLLNPESAMTTGPEVHVASAARSNAGANPGVPTTAVLPQNSTAASAGPDLSPSR